MISCTLAENITEYEAALNSELGLASWEISIIVLLAVFALLCVCYCLLFFTLNKFIVVDGKIIRAFRVGTNNGQIHLLTFKFTMEYRIPEQVYETKQKAEEANCKD